MAFDPDALDVLANTARGFTLWHYRTPDSLDDVLEPGYFNLAANLMAPGDRIQVDAGWGVADVVSHFGEAIVIDVGLVGEDQHLYVRVSGGVFQQPR